MAMLRWPGAKHDRLARRGKKIGDAAGDKMTPRWRGLGRDLLSKSARRRTQEALVRMGAGTFIGSVVTSGMSYLASRMGAMPAALAPQLAVLVGLGAAGVAFMVANGDRSRLSRAAPAFVACEAVFLGPARAAVAGGVTVGLLWAAQEAPSTGSRGDQAEGRSSAAPGHAPPPPSTRRNR